MAARTNADRQRAMREDIARVFAVFDRAVAGTTTDSEVYQQGRRRAQVQMQNLADDYFPVKDEL